MGLGCYTSPLANVNQIRPPLVKNPVCQSHCSSTVDIEFCSPAPIVIYSSTNPTRSNSWTLILLEMLDFVLKDSLFWLMNSQMLICYGHKFFSQYAWGGKLWLVITFIWTHNNHFYMDSQLTPHIFSTPSMHLALTYSFFIKCAIIHLYFEEIQKIWDFKKLKKIMLRVYTNVKWQTITSG